MKPVNKPVFDSQWRAATHIAPMVRSHADWMIGRHYLRRWPGVCTLILGLYKRHLPIGVIVFALPPTQTAVRYGGAAWELARLWVSDEVPQNAESYFMGAAIRYVKNNFKNIRFLVTYADPSAGHSGAIYRATNWIADGRTDDERKSPRCDYKDVSTGKVYSRRSHVPDGVIVSRVPRVSKFRFYFAL